MSRKYRMVFPGILTTEREFSEETYLKDMTLVLAAALGTGHLKKVGVTDEAREKYSGLLCEEILEISGKAQRAALNVQRDEAIDALTALLGGEKVYVILAKKSQHIGTDAEWEDHCEAYLHQDNYIVTDELVLSRAFQLHFLSLVSDLLFWVSTDDSGADNSYNFLESEYTFVLES